MKKSFYQVDEVIKMIQQGKNLLLSGDEDLLSKLPDGNWIGGTTPYFMTEQGGEISRDFIMVDEIPDSAEEVLCKSYDISNIQNVYKDGFEKGFSIIIIPSASKVHLSFALNANEYEGFATKPLIGWISGLLLDDLNVNTAKTFLKSGNSESDSNAVVMHVKLPSSQYAEISIQNIFKQGNGDVIEFPETTFHVNEAIINGKIKNFAEYVKEMNLDLRLPLVADYSGCMINISFQSIDEDKKVVNFYAPVFKGAIYKQAAPIEDYVRQFEQLIQNEDNNHIAFSCNCILNFLYSELEGKKTGNITGPITFGEIAYVLLNQTMVSLEIKNLE